MSPPDVNLSSESIDKLVTAMMGRQQSFNNVNTSDPSSAFTGGNVRSGRTDQESLALSATYFSGLAGKMETATDTYLKGINDMFMGHAKNYEMINESIGGYLDHSKLAESSATTMKQYVERYDQMIDAYGTSTDEFVKLQKDAGVEITAEQEARMGEVGTDFITKYFKSGEAAAKVQNEVLNELVTQNAQAINDMDEFSRMELALINRNTGIGAKRIAQIMENELVRTGEATNNAMFKVAGFSKKMSEETGLSLKLIQDSTTRVMENIQQFGHVTEEEATRISVQIQQLGMKFETFEGLTQKFQDFDTAASAMGDISQLTGGAVQFDAQEMAYLASEDQDEFLRVLRGSFLESGFDKDQFLDMTNAEQRAIAESMGMQRNEFAMLIDRERDISSKEQLDQIMKEATEEGLTTEKGAMEVIKEQKKALDNSIKSSQELMDAARKREMDRNRKFSTETIENMVDFRKNALIALDVPEIAESINKSIAGAMKSSSTVLKDVTEKIIDKGGIIKGIESIGTDLMQPMFDVFKGGGESAVSGMKEGSVELQPSSLPPLFQKVVDETGKYLGPGFYDVFKIAGEMSAKGMTDGLGDMGIDPLTVLKGVKAIKDIKTKPMMLQNNIDRVLTALEEVKKQDIEKYGAAIEQLTENIKIINETTGKLSDNQTSLLEMLGKGKEIVLNIDGKKVGEAILDRSPDIENIAGIKFVTEG